MSKYNHTEYFVELLLKQAFKIDTFSNKDLEWVLITNIVDYECDGILLLNNPFEESTQKFVASFLEEHGEKNEFVEYKEITETLYLVKTTNNSHSVLWKGLSKGQFKKRFNAFETPWGMAPSFSTFLNGANVSDIVRPE